jgi:hypothetical protein
MKDDSKSDKLAVVKNVAAAIDVQQFVVLQQAIFENKQLTPKLVVVLFHLCLSSGLNFF